MDRLRGLHIRAGGQEAGQLVAREQRPVQVRLPRRSRVIGVRQDRVQHRLRPSPFAQVRNANERMLLERRVTIVIHVVQQPGHRIQLHEALRVRVRQLQPLGFAHPVRLRAGLHRKSMPDQRCRCSPSLQELPGRLTIVEGFGILIRHWFTLLVLSRFLLPFR